MNGLPLTLASRLREHTRIHHINIESHLWVKLLFSDQLPLGAYVSYLRLLLPVYEYMEQELKKPFYRAIYFLLLNRSDKIKQDLLSFSTTYPKKLTSDCNPYLNHIKKISTPELWISHYYVRYFGDLQGGRLIKKKLKTSFFLEDSALNTYDFSEFESHVPSKIHTLRQAINSFQLTPTEVDAILLEAEHAFKLTGELMQLSLEKK